MSTLQNTVHTVFRADTASYTAAVKHMRGVERAEAQKTLAALEQQNAKFTDQLSLITKAGAVVGGLAIAWKAANAAANAHIEDLRLGAAAAGANIDKLRDATRGLVETDNLLMFAGKAMHGVWKLNQAEMEAVAKGTRVLAKDLGIDLKTAMEGVTESVTKGTTRSLKELGIEVKDKSGLIEKMTDASKRWGQAGASEGEKWTQATVAIADAWDDAKGKMGELVVALAPFVKLVAELAGLINGIADKLQDIPGFSLRNLPGMPFGVGGTGGISAGDLAKMQRNSGQGPAGGLAAGMGPVDWSGRTLGPPGSAPAATAAMQALGILARAADTLEKGARSGRVATPRDVGDPMAAFEGMGGGASALGVAIGSTYQGVQAGARADATSRREMKSTDAFKADMEAVRTDWESWYPQMQADLQQLQNQPTVLEQIFGKPDEITATMVAIDVARAGVEAFGQAGAAAMGAWIDGEKSMGEAIKAVLANSLKALAMESTVKALFELAQAAGAAAWGNLPKAGLHLKSAALYGAVAVAAGVGAKAAHGAGWSGSASGGGAGAAIGGGRGGRGGGGGGGDEGGGDRTTVLMLGGGFYGLSDLEQRQLAGRAIRLGNQQGGGGGRLRLS